LNPQGRLALAANYARNNAHGRAVATYRRVVTENPDLEEAWHQYGSLVLANGDTLEAERIFRKGLARFRNRLWQQTGPLWGQLVTIYDSDRALSAVLAEDPFDTEFAEPLVDVFVAIARRNPETADRKYGRAEMVLGRMIERDSTRSALWGKTAEIMLATDRPGEARSAFEQAIRIDNKAQHWLGLAHTYLAQNRLEDAVGILHKLHGEAPRRSPLYPQIVFALGGAYVGIGRIQDARGVYLRASEADPGEVRYRYELGRTYALERDWEKAVPVFEALADQLEGDPELLRRTLFQLGRCLERGGRIESAIAVLQRLLTLDPENHRALNYLGYTLVDRGIRLKEAEQLIQRALNADPQNGAYLDSMGWVYYQQGRYKEALDHLVRAANLEEAEARNLPPDPRSRAAYYEELSIIHDHIGDTARALLDYDMARRHWKRALECDPANEAVRKKLQALDSSDGGAPGEP
jgi:tetratricopeptide (TPR) repeat protein